MAQIGCLGDIIFSVSDDVIRTFSNATWSGSARYSTHNRHLNNALTEFTGVDPDKFTLEIKLFKVMGVEPMVELVKIWNHERAGRPLSLAIGQKPYGKFKWCIEDHKISFETYDTAGNLSGATVSLSLLEYLNR